jgi:hypothetical protein
MVGKIFQNTIKISLLIVMDAAPGPSIGAPPKRPELVFIETQRGHPALLYNGYRYNLNKTNKSTNATLWRCANRGECSASIKLNPQRDNIDTPPTTHACRRNKFRNEVEKLFDSCKKEVCRNFAPVKKIFEEKVSELHGRSKRKIKEIDMFTSKKDTLYRKRRSFLNVSKTECQNLNEVKVPEIFARDFLVWDDGENNDKILMFCTKECETKLRQVKGQFFGDSTFKSVPKPFYQFFSLHLDIGSDEDHTNIVPMIYALLPNKQKNTYIRLFDAIKTKLSVQIDLYKCDYEVAQYNAFQIVYPEAQLTGCYFHFNKSVWKKGNDLNLTTTREGSYAVRLTANLPLLPTKHISEAWIEILQITPDTQEMQNFHTYVNKQWLSLPMISCANEKHRTTNSVEAWHRRLNSRVSAKPTFISFLETLRKEARLQDMRLTKNIFNVNNRKRVDKIFNAKYLTLLSDLQGGLISSFECLEKLSELKRKIKIYHKT